MDNSSKFCCAGCGHAFFYHKESREYRLINARSNSNFNSPNWHGCSKFGCACKNAIDNSGKETK